MFHGKARSVNKTVCTFGIEQEKVVGPLCGFRALHPPTIQIITFHAQYIEFPTFHTHHSF